MTVNKLFKNSIIVGILLFSLLLFLWFQYRPSQIRQLCLQRIRDYVKENVDTTNKEVKAKYNICFIEYGMKPEKLYNE